MDTSSAQFSELQSLGHRQLEELLRRCDRAVLAVALSGAQEGFRLRALNLMSPRVRAWFEDALTSRSPWSRVMSLMYRSGSAAAVLGKAEMVAWAQARVVKEAREL